MLDGLVLRSGGLNVPSVGGGDISGDVPSVDAKLTGSGVDVEGGDGVSLGAELAADVTAAVGATAIGLGLSGKADKPEGEVRHVCFCACLLCSCFVLGVVSLMNRFQNCAHDFQQWNSFFVDFVADTHLVYFFTSIGLEGKEVVS